MRLWTLSGWETDPCAPSWCGMRDCYCYDERSYGYFFHAVAIAGALSAERSKGFREGWDIAYHDGPITPKAPVNEPREGVYVKQVKRRDLKPGTVFCYAPLDPGGWNRVAIDDEHDGYEDTPDVRRYYCTPNMWTTVIRLPE